MEEEEEEYLPLLDLQYHPNGRRDLGRPKQ
jgi:hypothetical protein